MYPLGPQVWASPAPHPPAQPQAARPAPTRPLPSLPRAPGALFLPCQAQPDACGGMQRRTNPRGPRHTAPGPSRAALGEGARDPAPRSRPSASGCPRAAARPTSGRAPHPRPPPALTDAKSEAFAALVPWLAGPTLAAAVRRLPPRVPRCPALPEAPFPRSARSWRGGRGSPCSLGAGQVLRFSPCRFTRGKARQALHPSSGPRCPLLPSGPPVPSRLSEPRLPDGFVHGRPMWPDGGRGVFGAWGRVPSCGIARGWRGARRSWVHLQFNKREVS